MGGKDEKDKKELYADFIADYISRLVVAQFLVGKSAR